MKMDMKHLSRLSTITSFMVGKENPVLCDEICLHILLSKLYFKISKNSPALYVPKFPFYGKIH